MSMLRTCSTPGCETLTLGEHCLEHELANAAVRVVPHRSPAIDLAREPDAEEVEVASATS